ncbi:hypothetical protein JHK87_034017 [Glycine soja]|nr:hypothetical protein JHK87_034017 [Glycine soja]
MCLTLEGKLVMFHVASFSLARSKASPEVDSVLHNEDEGCTLPQGFLSSYNNLQATTEKTRELWTSNGSRDSQRASNLLPGETFSFPKKFDVSSILASSYADGVDFQNKKCTMGATNDLGSIGGKPFLVQDVNDISPTINFSNRLVQSRGNYLP